MGQAHFDILKNAQAKNNRSS
ncbi:uncharacterized protein G2W53_010485 [Senna tora]|uniref:Uncharacterized protein n=1 Tax=Senna tora TaxID=362788 RepID=A0A834X002_9FABA|nr:uncharacterized protein G2W53_010485 [Senna tora]